MTKTYAAKAAGTTYRMTVEDTTTPTGTTGLLISCSCPTHNGNSGRAIIATPTVAADFPKSRIHGHVTMAHSPIGGRAEGVWKA